MKTTKITHGEIVPMLIASLPTRPTAPSAFGGKGYTATEMKEAFDKLPIYIIDRLNLLIDDITSGDICDSIPTGISNAPSLAVLLGSFINGRIGTVIKVQGKTLSAHLEQLRADVDYLLEKVGQSAEEETQ